MNRISKIFLAITVLLQLCWLLPWCYSFLNTKSDNIPFVMYSSLLEDFISMNYSEEEGLIRRDTKGNDYTLNQTDSLLPFFYVRQLMADERFPETIAGMKITPHEIQMTNFNFRAIASDINKSKIGLYPLLESMPKRVDLEMSKDVFRITDDGIEFIIMETNEKDLEKSQSFTEVMKSKGFVFPAREIAGNPTTRKEYDEGYLLLDAEGKLFHMKQTCGRPYVRFIETPEGLELNHLFITEFYDHYTLGFMTDINNKFYVLMAKTYKVIQTGVPSYNPEEDNCFIIGNILDWTVNISTEESDNSYAIDARDFHLIQSVSYPTKNYDWSILSFTSFKDKFVKARFFD